MVATQSSPPKDFTASMKNGEEFVLTTAAIAPLQAYVAAGAMLPITAEAYRDHVNITEEKFNEAKIKIYLEKVISAYALIRPHCEKFRDETYRNLVSLASDVHTFAGKSVLYYPQIFKRVAHIGQALDVGDEAMAKKVQGEFNKLIDAQVKQIQVFSQKVEVVSTSLTEAETEMNRDKETLSRTHDDLNNFLTGSNSELDKVNKEIEKERAEISKLQKDDMEEYRKTTEINVWLFVDSVCTIGVSKRGIDTLKYMKHNADMRDKVSGLQTLIQTQEASVATELRIIQTGKASLSDLDKFTELIGPAIQALQKLKGAWLAFANDLTSIKEAVAGQMTGDGSFSDSLLVGIEADFIERQWNELKRFADEFRRSAFVTVAFAPLNADINEVFAKIEQGEDLPY